VVLCGYFTKENIMAMPAGIVKKTKDNSRKLYRNRAAWMIAKKANRPYQQFNEETKEWSKIMLPTKVTA
jgi:hypothetical protein